jgi:hypothetical protein
MKGFVVAEEGQVVNILPAVDITGGATVQAFSMARHQHATIILSVGVSAAAWTKIIVDACVDKNGGTPTAIPFSIYKQETAGASHCALGARTAVLAAGYTPSANDNIFYIVEIDASELPDGSPYVLLSLTNGANSVIAAAVAILTGSRFAGQNANEVEATA